VGLTIEIVRFIMYEVLVHQKIRASKVNVCDEVVVFYLKHVLFNNSTQIMAV